MALAAESAALHPAMPLRRYVEPYVYVDRNCGARRQTSRIENGVRHSSNRPKSVVELRLRAYTAQTVGTVGIRTRNASERRLVQPGEIEQ